MRNNDVAKKLYIMDPRFKEIEDLEKKLAAELRVAAITMTDKEYSAAVSDNINKVYEAMVPMQWDDYVKEHEAISEKKEK